MEMNLGHCIFNDKLQVLMKDEQIITLGRKPTFMLKKMLCHKNELVTKAMLVDSVWDGRDTSLATINQTMYLLRKAFKALNDNSIVIKSIKHSGYVLTTRAC